MGEEGRGADTFELLCMPSRIVDSKQQNAISDKFDLCSTT